ncbi:MAG: hypothetical protein PF517_20745 [Salinivirgaceae bacterium]|nr:hypothetical protein [Salinivirgaceae bacterium]
MSISQVNETRIYDIFQDTLLIINGKAIDSERILMKRLQVVEADTFEVNQKGIKVLGFTMTAFALGRSIELISQKPIFSKEMKDEILNKQTNFKFISIKNINLQTKDGRAVNPSLETIKIIFGN